MGTYDGVYRETGWGIPTLTRKCGGGELAELLDLTRSEDPKVRSIAVKHLCPCHVRSNHPEVWERVFELVDDPDPRVRRDAVHALADGSPRELADRVGETLEARRNDPDRVVRRQMRKVVDAWRRTGRVNVL